MHIDLKYAFSLLITIVRFYLCTVLYLLQAAAAAAAQYPQQYAVAAQAAQQQAAAVNGFETYPYTSVAAAAAGL